MHFTRNHCIQLLLFLAFHVLKTTSIPYKYEFHILNGIQEPLTFKCWSGNDDLGTHTLSPNQDYSRGFRDLFWIGKHSVYYCEFHRTGLWQKLEVVNTGWPNQCGDVDIDVDVDVDVDSNVAGCRTFRWWVKPEGFYLAVASNPSPDQYTLKAPWNHGV